MLLHVAKANRPTALARCSHLGRRRAVSSLGTSGVLPVPYVLPTFPPVRWAAAYGSAALLQSGYKKGGGSMVDYVFVVDSAVEFYARES